MYLKKLTLLGFKTFADKTDLEFTPGITAIVGPNGGGKSNICDALRFCLGEQSTKTLRGSKLEDLIFTGTNTRKPVGLGEVEILFDNSNKTLPIDFEEVSILRRIFRAGENQHLINKTPCRLKDIQELFLDTGIGQGGLSFLSQTEVDQVLSSSDDRRAILEEVAGTNKYKFRKKEAARKLEQTESNIARLKDILIEVENQLKNLEKQVRKFRRYKKYQDKLKELGINYVLSNLKIIQAQLEPLKEKEAELKNNLNNLKEKLEELFNQKNALENNLWENEKKLEQLEEKNHQIKLQAQKKEDFLELLTERKNSAVSESEQLRSQNNILDEKNKANVDKITDIENTLHSLKEKIKTHKSELESYKNFSTENPLIKQISDLTQVSGNLSNQLQEAQTALGEVNLKYNKLKEEYASKQARLNLLGNLQEELADFSSGRKTLLEDQNKFPRLKDSLVNLIKVKAEYGQGIGSALNSHLESLITTNFDEAYECIKYLKETDSGRARIQNIENLPQIPQDDLNISSDKVLGKAIDFVQTEPDLLLLVNFLLQKTWLVADLQTAFELHKEFLEKQSPPPSFVTLEGDFINSTGQISGGGLSKTKQNLLAIKSEEIKLSEETNSLNFNIEGYLKEKNNLEAKIISIEENLNINQANLKELKEELNKKIQSVEIELAKATEQINFQQQQKEIYSQQKEEYSQEINQNQEKIKQLEEKITLTEENKINLQKEITQFKEEISKQDTEKNKITEEKTVLENNYHTASQELQSLQSEKQKTQDKIYASEIKSTELVAKSQNYKEKLQEFGSSGEEINWETVVLIEDKQTAEKQIERLKNFVNNFTGVNLGAEEEYQKLTSRFEYLSGQIKDLEEAKISLQNIIKEYDEHCIKQFQEIFNLADQKFREVFTKLFSGGEARLKLTIPENILESGVDIIAKPPGKKPQNLSLLSGGERALTAVAFLFALLEIKQSPFIVLDELDAPLDDSNIEKVAKLIRHYSGHSQFIMITHNRKTMEIADALYGVTMEEQGVSKLVSVKLTDNLEERDFVGASA